MNKSATCCIVMSCLLQFLAGRCSHCFLSASLRGQIHCCKDKMQQFKLHVCYSFFSFLYLHIWALIIQFNSGTEGEKTHHIATGQESSYTSFIENLKSFLWDLTLCHWFCSSILQLCLPHCSDQSSEGYKRAQTLHSMLVTLHETVKKQHLEL